MTLFGTFIFFMLVINLFLVYFVAQDAAESGYDWMMWGVAVFLFGIVGIALYFFYKSQDPQSSKNHASSRFLPSLQVQGQVINGNGDEKTVSMIVRSNDMVKAKEMFRESCAEKGLILKDEPSISVKQNTPQNHSNTEALN